MYSYGSHSLFHITPSMLVPPLIVNDYYSNCNMKLLIDYIIYIAFSVCNNT